MSRRQPAPAADVRVPKRPDGSYVGGLHSKDHLLLVGQIITYLPQIEERMIDVMSLLMGHRAAPGRPRASSR